MVAKSFCSLKGCHARTILFILLSLTSYFISAQEDPYKYFYRIYFKDKGEHEVIDFTPSQLFTQRAIERREKNGIQGLDFKDLPVYSEYLDIISSMGLKLHCTSRWMNTAVFKTYNPIDLLLLQQQTFVSLVKVVKSPVDSKGGRNKLDYELITNTNMYDEHILMLNGQRVHSLGWGGTGIIIAILDAGFMNADKVSSLSLLQNRNGIIETYDFVAKRKFVYDYHKHGTAILSILAGYMDRYISAIAPGADYLLIRTEDASSEFPVEEDFWVAGAEYADSTGCDIISSSLGYFKFDDPSMDYKYSDMNGSTTFVTQAAEIAVTKGIVVVNSAGNERNNEWIHIIAPSDGPNVIAVGAVDWGEKIAPFSSAGPSFDNRIKPDVVAQGVYVPIQTDLPDPGWPDGTSVGLGSGTSFSCPIISGMIACLMQGIPEAKAKEFVNVIRIVSDRYNSPDSLYGYGVPDMAMAVTALQRKFLPAPKDELSIGPNPFYDHINILFKESPEKLKIELFDATGRPVKEMNFYDYISLLRTINNLQNLRNGLYFIRITTSQNRYTFKLIKAFSLR